MVMLIPEIFASLSFLLKYCTVNNQRQKIDLKWKFSRIFTDFMLKIPIEILYRNYQRKKGSNFVSESPDPNRRALGSDPYPAKWCWSDRVRICNRSHSWKKRRALTSVAEPDPDPYDFGPPGSGSIITRYRYGSGSFYNYAEIVRKTLIPGTVLWRLYDFLSLKNDVNAAPKVISKKTLVFLVSS